MSKRKKTGLIFIVLIFIFGSICISACGQKTDEKRIEIELVSYKPEAVEVFEKIAERFNAANDDIYLKVDSPNEAVTILKTRFIREDYPDIIGIAGDITYSNFLDAQLFMDISDLEELKETNQAYLDIDKELEFVPVKGRYALPYMANAAGVLYNKDIFKEYGWKVPTTWQEFISLCEKMKKQGIQPLYSGYKDTWTCLAPWNALAVGLTEPDTCSQVNRGITTFSEAYKEVAEKMKVLLEFAQPNPYAYGYTDACTAFAREEAAMYIIGSYAIPQIKSVNPDMNIGAFTFPANEIEEENVLNAGIDLQFCVLKNTEYKKEVYEVLHFLYKDETIQLYLEAQGGIACKKGDFNLPAELEDMRNHLESGKMADYQDHYYPNEMAVDAMVQTFLIDKKENAVQTFLTKFDKDWKRYNRDLIRKVQEHQETKEDTQ